MTNTSQFALTRQNISKLSANLPFAVFRVGFHVTGFDQCQLFSMLEGQATCALVDGILILHEFTIVMRHAFGCQRH
jgi:hypothetical protein